MDLFSCPRCNMTFKSSLLLVKHKEKFCIGGNSQTKESETPQYMTEKERDFKRRCQEQRKQHLRLEREHQRALQNSETRPQHQVPVRKPNSEPTGGKPSAHWMQGHDTQVKQLEKQRGEIDHKLQELTSQTKNMSQLERMLFELKAQEQRNTLLLESLMDQLQHIQMDSGHDKLSSRHSNSRAYTPKTKEKVEQTYVPVYGNGVLSSEISALRLSYLQGGGSSALILAQLQDLLNEALQVEMQPKRPQPQPHHRERRKRGQDSNRLHAYRNLIATEMENQRLEEEIMKLQMMKRRGSTFIRSTHTERPSEQEVKAMKMDIDLLKHEIEIKRLRGQIRTRKPQSPLPLPPLDEARSQTPALVKYFLEPSDGLGPAPYDPVAGFVVFYDFLLGLCSSYRVSRLMVGLYSGDQELGSPSLLPPVYCEPASLSAHAPQHKRGYLATLATRQAVPRVRPAPAVSLVLQLQASGGYDSYGQEVARLASRGWVKVDIFDHHYRVISGRWKVPVRILPAKPSMTTGEINAVPQLDNAELYMRIVNARDSDIQSSAPISHSNAGLYRYPPVMSARNHFATHGSRHSFRVPYCPNAEVHLPAFTESVDPPQPAKTLLDDLEWQKMKSA